MPAAREPHYLTGVFICLSPGLVRITEPGGRRERLHHASPAKVTVEELARQWPSSAWQRFRLLEGHKGPLVADFLVLRAVLPLDRLPGPEVWVVIRRKVSGEAEEPEWKF